MAGRRGDRRRSFHFHDGELALGKNPLIGFMTWEGYNYEDAVLLSERLVQDDVYTSVHIEEYEAEAVIRSWDLKRSQEMFRVSVMTH